MLVQVFYDKLKVTTYDAWCKMERQEGQKI